MVKQAVKQTLKAIFFAVTLAGVRCQYQSPASPPGQSGLPLPPECPTGLPFSDVDIMNFALNLECLEAQFYTYAAYGHGIPSTLTGGGPAPLGGQKANLSPQVQQFAQELSTNEQDHVSLLRSALGQAAVPCPQLDIGSAFQKVANLAFNKTLNPPYNPYMNDLLFGIAVYIFEDVGVTADNGLLPFIKNKTILQVTASIMGTEAYHAGATRALLSYLNNQNTPFGVTVGQITDAIATLRDNLGMVGLVDEGTLNTTTGSSMVVDSDKNSLVYHRFPQAVINIVKVFFPQGLNGYFH